MGEESCSFAFWSPQLKHSKRQKGSWTLSVSTNFVSGLYSFFMKVISQEGFDLEKRLGPTSNSAINTAEGK